jgi:hypothetical protein
MILAYWKSAIILGMLILAVLGVATALENLPVISGVVPR